MCAAQPQITQVKACPNLSSGEALFCHWPAIAPPLPVNLVTVPEETCAYLPDNKSQVRAFHADDMPPDLYHKFMDAAFRRSGRILYQPVCQKCRGCIPIRIPVAQFHPGKSQRRCGKRNHDLSVRVDIPVNTDEKWELYRRYQSAWHHRPESDRRESFDSFLYDSPVDSLEFSFRDTAGRLLAVSICDISTQSLSSVYCWFDPADTRRSLGTFAALTELAFARRHKIMYYYMGYWIAQSRKMLYKTAFRPYELLGPDGLWRRNSLESSPCNVEICSAG